MLESVKVHVVPVLTLCCAVKIYFPRFFLAPVNGIDSFKSGHLKVTSHTLPRVRNKSQRVEFLRGKFLINRTKFSMDKKMLGRIILYLKLFYPIGQAK